MLLGFAGCVQVSNPAMPAEWPALVQLAAPDALDGIYSGDLREMGLFGSVFFRAEELYDQKMRFRVEHYRVGASGNEITIEALAGGHPFAKQRWPGQMENGAWLLERQSSGHEGLAVASYRNQWRFQLNTADELVVRHHQSSLGVVFPVPAGSSTTTWWKLKPVRPSG